MKRILVAAALVICSGSAGAQQFPAKPIHLVVTFAAGGAMDLTARSMAAVMSESFGQVVVENRTGGGGLVGTDYVARAAPDGYTLLMYADVNVIAPFVYKKLNHDPIKDFAPITNAILGTHLIVGHPSVKANTLRELIELAKREPGKLTFGSPGTAHAAAPRRRALQAAGRRPRHQHVPYRGGGQLIGDLIGGQVPLGLIGLPPTLPHIKRGQAQGLRRHRKKALAFACPTCRRSRKRACRATKPCSGSGRLAPAGTPRAVDQPLASPSSARRSGTPRWSSA